MGSLFFVEQTKTNLARLTSQRHVVNQAGFVGKPATFVVCYRATSTFTRSRNSSMSISVALPFRSLTRSSETACTSCRM